MEKTLFLLYHFDHGMPLGIYDTQAQAEAARATYVQRGVEDGFLSGYDAQNVVVTEYFVNAPAGSLSVVEHVRKYGKAGGKATVAGAAPQGPATGEERL